MKNKKHRRSFIWMNMLSLAVSALLLTLLFFSANFFTSYKTRHTFPSTDDLLQYESALKNDRYSQLPKYIIDRCHILVFDGMNRVVYATDATIKANLDPDNLSFIPSQGDMSYYVVTSNHSSQFFKWYIQRYEYNEDSDEDVRTGYCSLNEEYQILDGNLFEGRDALTEEQLGLLQGVYDSANSVVKVDYETDSGEQRLLVFVSPTFSYETYQRTQSEANRIWLFLLPLALILLALQSILLSRREKKSLLPLQKAMVAYGRGEAVTLDKTDVPLEFETIAETFSQLTASLTAEQHESQRMLADISHDLKTPLTVIRGYAQAFLDGKVPPDKQQSYLATIYQKSDMSARLIDTLFEYTKLGHPEYALKKTPEDLAELCRSYLAAKYSELEIGGFFLEVELPEEKIPFNCDREMICRLFENLFSNALKYNPRGTTVRFSLTVRGHAAHIRIADNGSGIPPEIAKTVFEAFVTGNIARTSSRGIGLGLAISKRIAELHGGSIALAGIPDQPGGTAFDITLPL